MMKSIDEDLTDVELVDDGASPLEAASEADVEKEAVKSEAREEGKPLEKSGNNAKLIWLGVAAAGALALIVGLSVGLTRGSPSGTFPTFNATLDTVSAETIQASYNTCEELREDLVKASGYLANSIIDRNARWYFHEEYRSRGNGGDMLFSEGASAAGDGSSGSSIPEPTMTAITEDSFETNNQVEGVEEADIVKSNGRQVFVSYGREVIVLEADNVTVAGRTELPINENCTSGSIAGMLLIEGSLVVIATGWCEVDYSTVVRGRQNTQVFVYAIEDMTMKWEESLEGNYVSARAIGENVHIVTSSWLNSYYAFTQYLDPYDEDVYGANIRETEYRTQAHFEAADRIDGFVNQLTDELNCETIQKLSLFQNSDDELTFTTILQSLATVYSFSVDERKSLTSTSMILPTSNWQVYASQNQLVLASEGWWTEGNKEAREETYLISYRLEGANATAVSLGTVPGYVLNQFSMNVFNQNGTDYLRVATTTRDLWTFESRWTSTADSTSQVTVLEVTDDTNMPVVGQLTDLGKPGERIYSVRFEGDKGYVVTFRETDPFYTLDLADPFNPKAVGELEIPGFSNYLHPIGNDLLIGVGQHADDTGRTSGLQISLFDVSDFANPSRIQNYVEDQGYSSSEAQYDHKALRYLVDSQILILPLTIYGHGSSQDGLDGFRLYKIDPAGIGVHMTIEHAQGDFYSGCWSRMGFLQPRSLVFGGDMITTKGHSILSYDLTTGLEDASPINLDEGLTDCTPYYFE